MLQIFTFTGKTTRTWERRLLRWAQVVAPILAALISTGHLHIR